MSKILIIGNVVLDQIMWLSNFPQQDDEMRASEKHTVIGGNACNSAQILVQLGHQVELMSSLGDDREAKEILLLLQSKGIDTSLCVTKTGHSSPYSSIWLNQQNGSRTITHFRNLPELSLVDINRINLADYDWVHFEGRNIETLVEFFESLPKTVLNSACTLSLEIEKPRDNIESLVKYIDVSIVSSQYLKTKEMRTEACIQQLRQINPSLKLALTLGKAGIVGCDDTGNVTAIPVLEVNNIIDTIGAGDCFIAGWIDALLHSDDFKVSLQSANKLAAYKIQHRGMNIEGYKNSNL